MKSDILEKRLALMMAFHAVVTHGKKTASSEDTQKIIDLARHIQEFCDLNFDKAFPQATDAEKSP